MFRCPGKESDCSGLSGSIHKYRVRTLTPGVVCNCARNVHNINAEAPLAELWVFAYGSLMWRPGFDHDAAVPALLRGAHRAFCVRSVVHRGTPRRPGLVLGLDVGGTCRGVAFRIVRGRERQTRAYLRARELSHNVYREVRRPVELLDGSGRHARAICFLINRWHRQYTGPLPLCEQAHKIRVSRGRAGANLDYLINTLCHLDELGIKDDPLHRLAALFGRPRAGNRA